MTPKKDLSDDFVQGLLMSEIRELGQPLREVSTGGSRHHLLSSRAASGSYRWQPKGGALNFHIVFLHI